MSIFGCGFVVNILQVQLRGTVLRVESNLLKLNDSDQMVL